MIDTDKYEGHTRGPWRYYDDEENDCWVFEGEDIEAQARVAFFAFTPCEGIAYLDDPDLNLMIDAPDLLAEVKRLLGKLESIENNMAWTVQVWQNENYMGRQDWMEQMCEIYTDLAKGIEAQYYGVEEE